MEDLNISGMMKNKNLSFKIANASWNRLSNFLEYKSKNANKIFRKSYRFYSSTKTCNNCKTESDIFKEHNSLNIREWICKNCGTHHDRDINAAKNIRDWQPKTENAVSNTILKLSNINELTKLDEEYIDELLEKDKSRKNKKYELANNKIKELKQLKPINIIENEIRYKQLNNICLRLETQNIK